MNCDRIRLLLLVFLLLGIPTIATAQSRRVPQATPTPPPREDDTERVETEEIKLNVVAFDDHGNFVRDVKAPDLVITENNILHQPSSVRRIPANVLIVLDTGGEQRQVKNLDQTRRTARALIAALNPGDSVAIMQYSDTAEIVGFLLFPGVCRCTRSLSSSMTGNGWRLGRKEGLSRKRSFSPVDSFDDKRR